MLRYVGNAIVPGIPGHDLNEEQVERYGGEAFLLSLKHAGQPLYEKAEQRAQPRKAVSRESEKNEHLYA